jgi:hypothetical protein
MEWIKGVILKFCNGTKFRITIDSLKNLLPGHGSRLPTRLGWKIRAR